MAIEWIHHNGVEILYLKLRGQEDDLIAQLDEHAQVVQSSTGNLRMLIDLKDQVATRAATAAAKKHAPHNEPYVAKSAVVGVTGFKSVLVRGMNVILKIPIVPYNSIEEALDYLAE